MVTHGAQELLAGVLARFKQTAQRSGGGCTGRITYAAGFHAVVNGIDGDRHVIGAQQRLQGNQDLLRQTLLNLRTLREELHNTVDLRQTNHRIFRNVSHGRFTVDSNEVMFAGAGQRDITYRDHLVHLHLILDNGNFREVGVIQARENFVDVHFRDALRRLHQTVIAQIEIQQLHDLGHMPGNQTFTGFIVHILNGRTQWRFETARKQGFMDQGSFFTE